MTRKAIVWQPKQIERSRMWQFMRFVEKKHPALSFKNYQQLHVWSITEPALFWQSLCDYFKVDFASPATQVLNQFDHMLDAQWFAGARLNFAASLLSRDDEHPALISVTEDGSRQVITYKALQREVARCAQGLKDLGVKTGDRVAAIMPNVSYTIIAMLATTAIGAVWSSCSPEFGAQAIIDRLGQIAPKVLFVGDGQQYAGKKLPAADKILAVSQAIPSLLKLIICPIINHEIKLGALKCAITWQDFLQPAPHCEFAMLPFAHPIYILFSSGTTGKPKCIIHGAGGTLLQHLKELGLHTDLKASDNLCFYTTCGWMMWNWMVSALALGATLTLYEGSPAYPDTLRMFQLIDQEKITVFGTSAKFISTVEKAGAQPQRQYALTSLRTILSTGSPLLPQNYDFVYRQIKADIQLSSISGGTDIISCFALGNPILPVYRGELQCLGLGMAVEIFNEQGQAVYGKKGDLVCTKPFPSMPVGFWQDPDKEKYKQAYFERFPKVWAHGDFAEITSHGGLIIYGRSDAILNPGGVRIGTAEIYRQIDQISEIVDSVVIGQDWQQDTRIVLFVKLREDVCLTEGLANRIRQLIRHNASPRHVPAKILQVADIPRTLSGKTVEIAVRQAVHSQPISNLQSLANPDALNYFRNRKELTD